MNMVSVREHYRGRPQIKALAKVATPEPDLFISVEGLKRDFPLGRIIGLFGTFGDKDWFWAKCVPEGPLVFAIQSKAA